MPFKPAKHQPAGLQPDENLELRLGKTGAPRHPLH
jgi:hypothetical protein